MAVSVIKKSRKRTLDKTDENSDDGIAVFFFVGSYKMQKCESAKVRK